MHSYRCDDVVHLYHATSEVTAPIQVKYPPSVAGKYLGYRPGLGLSKMENPLPNLYEQFFKVHHATVSLP